MIGRMYSFGLYDTLTLAEAVNQEAKKFALRYGYKPLEVLIHEDDWDESSKLKIRTITLVRHIQRYHFILQPVIYAKTPKILIRRTPCLLKMHNS